MQGMASVPGLGFRLIEERSGEAIALKTPSNGSSYNIAGRFGVPILSFTISSRGTYRLTSTLEQGGSARIAIAQGEISSMLGIALEAMEIILAGLVIGGIFVALTIWQRWKVPA